MDRHSHGAELARWGRARLCQELGGPLAVPPSGAWCEVPGATFVTLRWTNGMLQGCRGTLVPLRPIVADVGENAVASALDDPRSSPVRRLADVDRLDLELSILSPQEPIAFGSTEREALSALRPGVDGIVFEWRGRRATFLPSMWQQLPDPRRFMAELKMKAGFDAGFWDPAVRLFRYEADKHSDPAKGA
ncbi:MAG TPA: AmmeMemoRadiSam system protein A [Myxococcales bacterium]|nr:AmmeMemoRadiSam system protein A [Myxococcales bacterium]